jgi:hypothetical protein
LALRQLKITHAHLALIFLWLPAAAVVVMLRVAAVVLVVFVI